MPDAFFASNKTRKRKRTLNPSSGSRDFNKKSRTTKGPGSSSSFHQGAKSGAAKSLGKGKRKAQDEELESDRTDNEGGGVGGVDDMDLERRQSEDEVLSGDEYEDETPAEKRLRLAKLYLENVKEGLADGEFDAKDVDRELLNSRLKQDVLENKGRIHLFVANDYNFTSASQPPTLRTKGHRFSVTSAVASESGQHLFTSGKEGHIVKWDLHTGKKLATFYKQRPPNHTSGSSKSKGKGKAKAPYQGDIRGHTDEVLALALSGDGKVLVSGGRDKRLVVWDVEKDAWEKCFFGPLAHKDSISAVSFRKGTRQLYSASTDRSVKVYDLSANVMGYVETLFGHQDQILSLDALKGETCVSVGGRDKTVRFWKIVEETQLVFRGGGRSRIREVLEGGLRGDGEEDDEEEKAKPTTSTKKFVEGSLESVAMIDETTFLSGGDSGSICLWSTQKKKPVFTQPLAHGFNEVHSATEGLIQTPRWITALASLRYSDVFASGSWSNEIHIWKLDSSLKSFSLIGSVAAPGVVNSLQLFFPPTDFCHTSIWMPSPPSSTVSHPAPNGIEVEGSEPPIPQSHTQQQPNGDLQISTRPKKGVKTILLVAGMGQEHKFGRWLSVKEAAAANGTIIVAFNPSNR